MINSKSQMKMLKVKREVKILLNFFCTKAKAKSAAMPSPVTFLEVLHIQPTQEVNGLQPTKIFNLKKIYWSNSYYDFVLGLKV